MLRLLKKALLWSKPSLDLAPDVDHVWQGTARTKQANQISSRLVSGAWIPQQVLTETGSTLSSATAEGQGLSRSGMMSWEGGDQLPSPSQGLQICQEDGPELHRDSEDVQGD